jgi:hypothetical protein
VLRNGALGSTQDFSWIDFNLREQFFKLFNRNWLAEVVVLKLDAAVLPQEIQLCQSFHVLGNHTQIEVFGQNNDGLNITASSTSFSTSRTKLLSILIWSSGCWRRQSVQLDLTGPMPNQMIPNGPTRAKNAPQPKAQEVGEGRASISVQMRLQPDVGA